MRYGSVNNLSVMGFMEYCTQRAVNPNYIFMFSTLIDTLDPIVAYRSGLRSGFTKLADSARDVFSKVWSATHHPMYRLLEAYDSVVNLCMPTEVKSQMDKTRSFNTSGIPYTGEGGDFKLEAKNKGAQHWCGGNPTDLDWKNACINLDRLQEMKMQMQQQTGFKDGKDTEVRVPCDISEQTKAFRARLRQKKYLLMPHVDAKHTSLKGDPLSDQLKDFTRLASEKQARFYHSFLENRAALSNMQSIPFNEPPIFITDKERQDYECIKNQTIDTILNKTSNLIDQINDVDIKAEFESDLKDVKRARKKCLILQNYYVVEEYVNQQTAEVYIPTDEIETTFEGD